MLCLILTNFWIKTKNVDNFIESLRFNLLLKHLYHCDWYSTNRRSNSMDVKGFSCMTRVACVPVLNDIETARAVNQFDRKPQGHLLKHLHRARYFTLQTIVLFVGDLERAERAVINWIFSVYLGKSELLWIINAWILNFHHFRGSIYRLFKYIDWSCISILSFLRCTFLSDPSNRW